MNTRIRYKKVENQEHLFVTKEDFFGKDKVLYAQIDVNTMSYKVISREIEAGDEKVEVSGMAKTLVEVKKHVKATLKGLGVQFNDETRNKVDQGTSDSSN